MEIVAPNVVVARYGTYSQETDRDPIRWGGDGEVGPLVEYADVLTGDGSSRRMTLDRSINGDRLPEGSVADLTVQLTRKSEVVYRRDGRDRIIERDKWRIVAMAPVPPTSSKS